MKLILASCAALILMNACHKKSPSSDVKLVDSSTQVLELTEGVYGHQLAIDKGRIVMTVDKLGQIDYSIMADIAIADIKLPQMMVFKRIYKVEPNFVTYGFYKSASLMKSINYYEEGVLRATLMKTAETDQTVTLQIAHLGSDLSGQMILSEGKFGLATIDSIELSGQTEVKIDDPRDHPFYDFNNSGSFAWGNIKPILRGWTLGKLKLLGVK